MNCYRCGYDYSDSPCPVCGKIGPTDEDPVGGDGGEMRIAVLVPARDSLSGAEMDRLRGGAVHYRYEDDGSNCHHVFVYTPGQASALFDVLRSTESVRGRTILFNGRRRPYDSDLWLPLMWFIAS